MSFSIGGLSSGIDTASLVASLMQAERIPQQKLQRQQQDALKQVTSWNDLRTRMQALQTAAENLATPAKALGSMASSTDDKTLKATATAGAATGQYAIKVNQIATAQQRTKSDVGPLSLTVGAGRSVVQAGTRLPAVGTAEGAFALSVDWAGSAAGVQNVEVTRPSAAAAVYGNAQTTLTATDLTVAVDGSTTPAALTLQSSYAATSTSNPDGTTTTRTAQENLLKDLNDQLTAKGVAASASLVGGRLQIATKGEGSTRSLQLGGGAATALALPTTAAKGQSALVVVNGKSQEVEPVAPGGAPRAQALGDSGAVLQVGSSIGVGAVRANVVVTTATTTLSDLQGLLNATGSPVSAAVVAQDGRNTLVLSSTATGRDGSLSLSSPLATLADTVEKTPPADAEVEVNGLTVTRSSNKLTDLLPGLSLDLLSRPADESLRTITVTVARDTTGTSDRAKALVEAMNSFVGKVAIETKYDLKGKTGGPLVGDNAARSLAATLFQKAAGVVGTPALRSLSQLGIQTTRDGKFEFKPETLTTALAADPDGVAKLLSEFGSSVAAFAKESAQTGGLLTGRRDGAQTDADRRQKQAESMETRLEKVERRYKATYAAMETALASLKSQGGALNAALGSFSSNGS